MLSRKRQVCCSNTK